MEARVQLFGMAQVLLLNQTIAFNDNKRFQLLAYLIYKHDWVSREVLSNLFWDDTDSIAAQKNLRHLISRTKTLGTVQQ
jgi:DNA-binding SARP family transcriptional activator